MPDREHEVAGDEIAAIFARLRAEVRQAGSPGRSTQSSDQSFAMPARSEAERLWPVSAEKSLVRAPGLRGRLLWPVKRVLYRLIRWYVEPALADQREFNRALLRLVDELAERLASLEQRSRPPSSHDEGDPATG